MMENNIGYDMVNFRAKNNLSQTECAKRAGITLQTWNQIELGRQTPSRLTESKIRLFMAKKIRKKGAKK